jgi:hypothetical protein
MTKKDPLASMGETLGPAALLHMGEIAATWQKEMLEAYEQLNRAWVARAHSEVALWSELATKLTATRSVPKALEAYTKWAAREMQMTAERGPASSRQLQRDRAKSNKVYNEASRGPQAGQFFTRPSRIALRIEKRRSGP